MDKSSSFFPLAFIPAVLLLEMFFLLLLACYRSQPNCRLLREIFSDKLMWINALVYLSQVILVIALCPFILVSCCVSIYCTSPYQIVSSRREELCLSCSLYCLQQWAQCWTHSRLSNTVEFFPLFSWFFSIIDITRKLHCNFYYLLF